MSGNLLALEPRARPAASQGAVPEAGVFPDWGERPRPNGPFQLPQRFEMTREMLRRADLALTEQVMGRGSRSTGLRNGVSRRWADSVDARSEAVRHRDIHTHAAATRPRSSLTRSLTTSPECNNITDQPDLNDLGTRYAPLCIVVGMDAPGRHSSRIAVPKMAACGRRQMTEIASIGLDIAKSWFQVHGADAQGRPVLRRKLRRDQVAKFFAELAPTVIRIEACSTAHHWARTLQPAGHPMRLIPP